LSPRIAITAGIVGRVATLLTLSAPVAPHPAFSQGPPGQTLAESSSVVVRGRVLKLNASDEPLLPASRRTAVVLVQQMYAGSEIAGDQKGKNATVILTRPDAVKSGQEAFFFGNVRFVGTTMTIADVGESPVEPGNSPMSAALDRAGQGPTDRAILERLAAASMVFRGSVQDVRPIESRGAPAEHDPEWQVATVRVLTPLRGGDSGQVVTIAFPGSRDITWFNSPKLKPGQEAVFLAHTPTKEEEGLYRSSGLGGLMDKPPLYLVTEPYDVLRPTDETRVRGLLSRQKER